VYLDLVNAAATYRVRLTTTVNDRTWSEWIGLSKTGKAMRKDSEAKATRMSHEQAQTVRAQVETTIQSQIARFNLSQVTVVEIVD
jgi:hypothetical protein